MYLVAVKNKNISVCNCFPCKHHPAFVYRMTSVDVIDDVKLVFVLHNVTEVALRYVSPSTEGENWLAPRPFEIDPFRLIGPIAIRIEKFINYFFHVVLRSVSWYSVF